MIEPEPEQLGYACLRPSDWLQRFYQSVDRGELTLFMDTLGRDQIIPREVEQRFALDDGLSTVIIHADLIVPRAIPGQPGIEIRSISSELDMEGHIIETRAHVYAKPGYQPSD